MLTCDDQLPARSRRILVAGVSGCGKTTLAGRIARVTGAPHTELDALFHGPNWQPRREFLGDVQALVEQETWTTEWQYGSARPILAQYADLLVWLDPPFWRVTFPRVIRRTIHRRWHREVLWNGNLEAPLWTVASDPEHILRWAVRTRHKYAQLVPALVAAVPHLTIVRLTSPTDEDHWLTGPLAQRCQM